MVGVDVARLKFSFGGVVLSTKDKSILLKNTLDIRVETTFLEFLPDVRQILFE